MVVAHTQTAFQEMRKAVPGHIRLHEAARAGVCVCLVVCVVAGESKRLAVCLGGRLFVVERLVGLLCVALCGRLGCCCCCWLAAGFIHLDG